MKHAGVPRPVLLACPLGRPSRAWHGHHVWHSYQVSRYQGSGVVLLATEVERKAGLSIWMNACSNARAGQKRVVLTETTARSASRSSPSHCATW